MALRSLEMICKLLLFLISSVFYRDIKDLNLYWSIDEPSKKRRFSLQAARCRFQGWQLSARVAFSGDLGAATDQDWKLSMTLNMKRLRSVDVGLNLRLPFHISFPTPQFFRS